MLHSASDRPMRAFNAHIKHGSRNYDAHVLVLIESSSTLLHFVDLACAVPCIPCLPVSRKHGQRAWRSRRVPCMRTRKEFLVRASTDTRCSGKLYHVRLFTSIGSYFTMCMALRNSRCGWAGLASINLFTRWFVSLQGDGWGAFCRVSGLARCPG